MFKKVVNARSLWYVFLNFLIGEGKARVFKPKVVANAELNRNNELLTI